MRDNQLTWVWLRQHPQGCTPARLRWTEPESASQRAGMFAKEDVSTLLFFCCPQQDTADGRGRQTAFTAWTLPPVEHWDTCVGYLGERRQPFSRQEKATAPSVRDGVALGREGGSRAIQWHQPHGSLSTPSTLLAVATGPTQPPQLRTRSSGAGCGAGCRAS